MGGVAVCPAGDTASNSPPPEAGSVAGLGEFGLIARITSARDLPPATLLGPGDDAAVLSAADGRVVVSTDVLVEGVHFRLDWSTPHQVGRKAVAANLADIVAMGAVPTGLVVGLAVPGRTPVSTVDDLAGGMWEEATQAGVGIVGGDVVTAAELVVSVTALGDLQGRPPVTRGGARPGDVVVVAGLLGGSSAGLSLLLDGVQEGPLVDAHRRPSPPYALGPVLAQAGATALCDVSDGLVVDLLSLCTASRVGVLLDVDALPAAPGASRTDVLHGGEDHALLATVPLAAVDALADLGVVAVGRVREGGGVTDLDGSPLTPRGWEHWA
jgi:thiamine-monophosphate kinase